MSFLSSIWFPAGALTSKPLSFSSRPWEIEFIKSVDVFNSSLTVIKLGVNNSKIVQILSDKSSDTNSFDNFITDRTRFSNIGFNKQRLNQPLIYFDGAHVPCSWWQALKLASTILFQSQTKFFLSKITDRETIGIMYKFISTTLGQSHITSSNDNRSSFLCSKKLENLKHIDFCILVGIDTQHEFALISAKLNMLSNEKNLKIVSVGSKFFRFVTKSYGSNISEIYNLFNGKGSLAVDFSIAKNPIIIVGESGLNQIPSVILTRFKEIFNIFPLYSFCDSINCFDIGLGTRGQINNLFKINKKLNCFYFVNSNFIKNIKSEDFVIYQGSHGHKNLKRADLILPGCLFTEKSISYIDIFGQKKLSQIITTPPVQARTDWKIFKAISIVCSKKFSTKNFFSSTIFDLNNFNNFISPVGTFEFKFFELFVQKKNFSNFFEQTIYNYYIIDPITAASSSLVLGSRKSKQPINFFLKF